MSEAGIGPAVVSAVKALVAAYKNASSIVENIKEQRQARGAASPSDELEEALQEGQWEIEKIQAQGVHRFGLAFEQGDDIAYRALRELTIDAQSSFLTLAGRDDGSIDFEACVDSAVGARLRAVNLLNELYLRQQKSARSSSTSAATSSQRSSVAKPLPDVPRGPMDDMKEVVGASSPRPSITRTATIDSVSSGPPASERSAGSIKLSRKSSWGVFKLLNRTPSIEQNAVSPLSPYPSGSNQSFASPSLSPQMLAKSPSFTSVGPPLPSPQVMTPPVSPVRTSSSIDVLSAADFCKGAYYIQQGNFGKGLQVSAKNMDWSSHCRKCPFAVPTDNEHGRPRFDDRPHSTSKLRWRSLLLFKSHLSRSEKKKRIYKCVLCVLTGGADSSTTYDSEHDLFGHMFEHQGEVINGTEIWGPLCLEPSGLRVGSETTFDICFAENPRFALPESAFEMGIATEIFEADGTEIRV